MKTFLKIALFAGFAAFTSCSEVEPVIFNGNNTGNDTYLSFSRSAYDLPVERDLTGTVVITLNASTLSNVDRTYAIEIIPNTGISAANPATYSVPGQITIPAGEYQGTMTISGTDGGLVSAESKSFSIKLADSSLNGEYIDSNRTAINVFEVCALQSPFLGTYLLEQETSSNIGGVDAVLKSGLVELVEGTSPYNRQFSVVPYPDFGSTPVTVSILFKCDFLNVSNTFEAGIGCENGIELGPAASAESYDTTDDSVFRFTLTNDRTGDCTSSGEQITFKLTKQ